MSDCYPERNFDFHELKIHPNYFGEILKGNKTFEFREDDRGFKLGHTLYLCEWCPSQKEYTGSRISCKVSYILEVNKFIKTKKKYVVMSISDVKLDTYNQRTQNENR